MQLLREGILTPEQLKDIRLWLDLSQDRMAQLLGCAPFSVLRWEKGVCLIPENGNFELIYGALQAIKKRKRARPDYLKRAELMASLDNGGRRQLIGCLLIEASVP